MAGARVTRRQMKGESNMPNQPGASPVPDEEEGKLDDDDPGEVATSFATKGRGWSGRDKEEDEPQS